MSKDSHSGLGSMSMMDLFHLEVEGQAVVLTTGLRDLENNPGEYVQLEDLARAVHSIKGAAKMVDLAQVVTLAMGMEERMLAAFQAEQTLTPDSISLLLDGLDLLMRISELKQEDVHDWLSENGTQITDLLTTINSIEGVSPDLLVCIEDTSGNERAANEVAAHDAEGSITQDNDEDEFMLELFRSEVDSHAATLTDHLLKLEKDPTQVEPLEALMRAAHSIKGAARMVHVDAAVDVAHIMEDAFVAAQNRELQLTPAHIDTLLAGVDVLSHIAHQKGWAAQHQVQLSQLIFSLGVINNPEIATDYEAPLAASVAAQKPVVAAAEQPQTVDSVADTAPISSTPAPLAAAPHGENTVTRTGSQDNAIRVSAENLNRLVGMAGQVRVEARWLRPFLESLVMIKHRQTELIAVMDKLWGTLEDHQLDEVTKDMMSQAQHRAGDCRQLMSDRLSELEEFDRRIHNLSDRLSHEVISSRMRPFADGVQVFQRLVRDLSRKMGKNVELDLRGLGTQVDRDILEKIEAPLNHLVRNALDHGIETPEERAAKGKPEQATLRIEAMHSSGMLSIVVADDGRGIEPEELREKIVRKGMVNEEMAAELSEIELMDFLFLPGFSTREKVTELSGRGVGLDVVHSVVQEMRGVVRAISKPGQGMRFQMELPLTLSLVRTLIVEIADDPYAFPLARIDRTMKLHRDNVEIMEGRQYFTLGNQHVGLVSGSQVLGLDGASSADEEMSIVVLGERLNRYGLVVDRFLGERHLAVHTLDERLGKLKDISAAAILEDGAPCMIMDIDDLLRSIDLLVAGRRLDKISKQGEKIIARNSKRILVVDDSITVREVERKMLTAQGYEVEVAVDGMDGWNAVRTGDYDLVISDVDMPRMNGFEFVTHIKKDANLKSMPVMIVSYKDREEDRQRGLEVGADYYLTKGSFHDKTLIDAVVDLIGEA